MGLDASIYNLLGRGVKSFNEYQDEDLGLQAKKINLLGLKQAQEDDNALRDATKRFGTDTEANKSLIARTGNYKALAGYEKAQLDAAKARSDIAKDGAQIANWKVEGAGKQQDQRIKAHEFHLQNIPADPSQVPAWVESGVKSGVFTPEQAQAGFGKFQQLVAQPGGFDQWRKMALQGGLSALEQVKAEQKEREIASSSANSYMIPDGKGGFIVNKAYVDAKQKVAKSGASNVSVKVDAKLGEGIAKEVGPMLRDSYEGSQGAAQAISTADSLISAIDSGKVLTGPGATLRLKAAQLGQTLGIGGKDTAEQIANTRATIQGLAQSTLDARAKLKGQGTVTDSEQKLLQRAVSAEVDDVTAAEIKQIAQINKRLAQKTLEVHGKRVQKLKSNPVTADLATFYEDEAPAPAAPAKPGAVLRFDAQGNPIK